RSNEEALETIVRAVEAAGYGLGRDVYLGLDVASSEFFSDGLYVLESEGRRFRADEFAEFLEDLVARYPIVAIEDGLAEDDWAVCATGSSSSATISSSRTRRSSRRASPRRSRTAS